MATTTAMLSGMAGLNVSAARLEVIGNNIANVNTSGFKSNRMLFAPQFSQTLGLGTPPSGNSGGTNPLQVGLGVTVAGTQRNFSNGAIAVTGVSTDLAIEGQGFFVVDRGGEQLYTRTGSFQLNSRNEMVTITGEKLQGYAVDDNFDIVDGVLTDVSIPLGSLTLAEETDNVFMSGNLDADGDLAVGGAELTFGALTAGGPISDTTLLTAIDGGNMDVDDTITISGAARGGKTMPDATFTIDAASTVADLLGFLQLALGVVPEGGADPAMPEPGSFAVDGATGVITFTGNFGEMNDITLTPDDIVLTDAATGSVEAHPFTIDKTASANGESVRTTFIVYDSLGSPVSVDVTMVLAARNDSGTQWRAFVHAGDDSDLAVHLEAGDRTGTFDESVPMVTFDSFGQLTSGPSISVEVDRQGSGAAAPLGFEVVFDGTGTNVTSLATLSGGSTFAAVEQDGAPFGLLTSFGVGQDGVITGGFSNGLTRTIGRVVMAGFTNPEGLVDNGGALWQVGPNSGTPVIAPPGEFGNGQLFGGALEQSNVDLSEEFINMILTETGYSAASRVITTSDQLLQQLIAIVR